MLIGMIFGLLVWGGWAGFEAYRILEEHARQQETRAIYAQMKAKSNTGLYACAFDERCRSSYASALGRFPLHVVFGAGFVILGLLAGQVLGTETKVRAPAGASFAVEDQLNSFLAGSRKDHQKRGYLGVLPSGRVLNWPGDLVNMAITGNPGAGKSSRFLKPLIVKSAFDGCTSIIWDMKPGDFEGGFEDVLGLYQALNLPTYAVKPMHEDSVSIDVLEGVTTYADAMALCEMLIPEADKEEVEYYREAERSILANLIVDAIRRGQHLEYVYWRAKWGVKEFRKYVMSDPEMLNRLATTLDRTSERLSGLLDHIANRLEIFCLPSVARALCGQGTERLDLRGAFEQQSVIYVGIPKEIAKGPRGAYMARLIWRIIHQAADETIAATKRKRLERPVIQVIDEFTNWPTFHDIEFRISNMRSAGMCYMLAFQNQSQGYARYGEYRFDSTLEACQYMLYFPHLLSDTDKFKLERILGETVVIDDSVGVGSGALGSSNSRQYRHVKVPLLAASDMSVFPDGWAIVVGPKTRPIKVSLPHLDHAANPYREVYNDLRDLAQRHSSARFVVRSLEQGFANRAIPVEAQQRKVAPAPGGKPSTAPSRIRADERDELLLRKFIIHACESGWAELATLENQITQVKISRVGHVDARLEDLHWVTGRDDGVIVTRIALERLEEHYQRKLRQLARVTEVRRWLADHGKFVIGHANFAGGEVKGKLEADGERLLLNVEDALVLGGKGALRLKEIIPLEIEGEVRQFHPFLTTVNVEDLKSNLKTSKKRVYNGEVAA
jgi:Type IV secretion-system coupling protein DNA-binding domain